MNLLGNEPDLKTRVINYLSNHSDLKVNDDVEELYWEKLLTLFMDGSFQDEEAERIFDELTGKELDLEGVILKK